MNSDSLDLAKRYSVEELRALAGRSLSAIMLHIAAEAEQASLDKNTELQAELVAAQMRYYSVLRTLSTMRLTKDVRASATDLNGVAELLERAATDTAVQNLNKIFYNS